MANFSPVQIAAAIAGFAIGVLVLVKLFPGKPKRAEKYEKAQIMKQLLALSDQEESRRAPAVRLRPQPQKTAKGPTPAPVKAMGKAMRAGKTR